MKKPTKSPFTSLDYLPMLGTIGERLSWIMKFRGITQTELAETIGMDQTSISKIKRGKSVNPRKLDDIAAYLNVPVEWLRYGIRPEQFKAEHWQAAAGISELSEHDQSMVMDMIKRLKGSAD